MFISRVSSLWDTRITWLKCDLTIFSACSCFRSHNICWILSKKSSRYSRYNESIVYVANCNRLYQSGEVQHFRLRNSYNQRKTCEKGKHLFHNDEKKKNDTSFSRLFFAYVLSQMKAHCMALTIIFCCFEFYFFLRSQLYIFNAFPSFFCGFFILHTYIQILYYSITSIFPHFTHTHNRHALWHFLKCYCLHLWRKKKYDSQKWRVS